ncbi:uncharacterized protein PGTG_21987 [Puccinia graminis f. sp. tritici CRL 75-36-700-3]|uniref:Uncharacterized protein n=1 Tax=Puccinia graminis f. sp. tritici (strain CRL 75-36-700-3 / race SCCL) TaxID=418459 RepID=H6QT30_PUCGT|nr:uncharacterized protein PGTG_21987 [Puccinia graminis f. sp. tritici CRL 75-36-700-3]EHS63984.1 hypothetical protein PGTG_21987 [Puccinia graminis f. sp. tritici CRL 75-36-700-3]
MAIYRIASHRFTVVKSIEKNCRKHFSSQEKWEAFESAWKQLRLLPTLKECEENYAKLSKLWTPDTAAYLITVVLPLKEHFVAYLIDRLPHFENHITSRVESLHTYIKKFINTSTGSFAAVVKQIHWAIESQLHERYIESVQHHYKRLTGLPPSIANLNGIISHFALKIFHVSHMAKAPKTTCTGNYSAHMGIPCIHQVHNAKIEGTKFTSDDFHAQWHVKTDLDVELSENQDATETQQKSHEDAFLSEAFEKFQSLQPGKQHFMLGKIHKLLDGTHATIPLEEPKFDKNHRFKGRPKGSKRKHKLMSSTKRDPSGFEYVEGQKKKRGSPKKVAKLDEGPKRKPGQPRKKAAKKDDTDESEAMETDEESEDDASDGIAALCENTFTDEEHLEEEPKLPTVTKPLRIRPIKLVKPKPKPITEADKPDETPLGEALTLSTHENVDIDLYDYKDSIKPAGVIPHILHVKNVKGDGNCGV